MAAGSMNPLAAILTGKENSGGAAPWTPKGSLYCIFRSVEELIAEGFQPEGDVYIASSCTGGVQRRGSATYSRIPAVPGRKAFPLIDEGGMIMEEPIGGVKEPMRW